jgi:hypothetical protein
VAQVLLLEARAHTTLAYLLLQAAALEQVL